MPSDELRKKWGVIFMGDREATMDQLDAMQEPVLKERQQKDQQQDYIERVRKRAADRAREILGEAYAERQKILSEAQAEIDKKRAELGQEAEGIKAEAVVLRKQAAEELARAKQTLAEAETVRNAAHDEGYKSGMDQAGQELREFRADMGNELARIMRAIDGEFSRISQIWREDLCELVRVAISSGTAFILDTQNEAILTNLVNQAINLLEQRETISFRVNPEDEAIINDLFRAAREKAPEIRQWIVNPDELMERGGLVAESGSGSVDLRRQNFQELVDNLLQHIALPVQEEDTRAAQALHDAIEERALLYTGTPLSEHESSDALDTQPLPENAEAQSAEDSEAPLEDAVASAEPEPANQDDQSDRLIEKSEIAEEEPPEKPNTSPRERRAKDIRPENFTPLAPNGAVLADLEEELFPVSPDEQDVQDEEHAVLEGGGFLPDARR
ncbi:MAG: flagellar assembly protein FliH [Desulfovibrionaceae bacterium]|nr:flagellar assembly protein FliH [Desulfovibrionaceae bacterium]